MRHLWLSALFITLFCSAAFCTAADGDIRPAAVAGQFYPADPVVLRKTVDSLIAASPKEVSGKPFVVVCPHAGYSYSGKVAAAAFKQAAGNHYDLIVILGTNHTTAGFNKAAVFDGDGFQTPLGVAKVDRSAASQLLDSDSIFTRFDAVHRAEHSIEVQVPFIQVLFPNVPIVPIVVSTTDLSDCEHIGRELARLATNRSVLIVASSDLSHYPRYQEAEKVDHQTLNLIVAEDAKALHRYLTRIPGSAPSLVTGACGEGPILAGICAARTLGIAHGVRIAYANSGDLLPENRDRVVGYGAAAFLYQDPESEMTASTKASGGPKHSDTSPETLDSNTKRALLQLARRAITEFVTKGDVEEEPGEKPQVSFPAGAFVTLREHGQLRGCIGRLQSDLPLEDVVARYAVYAASEDPRFKPVRPGELNQLEIEISVLSPPRPVPGYQAIRIGRDGVVLTKDGHSATFLPQVADEQHWGRDEMLSNLCLKAGLDERCWTEGARFQTYQATVFSEADFGSETPH